ncbi:amidohydrolase [Kovacikia minuta CCNUW1]|uniref:amidohydrolase n=1 Tax=Kovacikia minuta TaxID=2931930 RepID=UPI001CC9769F|nr:amidohydrolase [Kovacikia minuta]UBF26340.1 amidohydrolase [Kovacikia minuta CCNUW1]
MSVLIQNVLIPVDNGYETVDVQVTGDRISAISSHLEGSETVIHGQDKLLLPGFVNGHTHSSQAWQRGLIPQLPLELWLADVLDSASKDLQVYYLGSLLTAVNTLLSGGTCLMDHAYLLAGQELESIGAAVRAYKEVGIRAFIAPLIFDEPFVAGFPSGRSLPHQPYSQSPAEILDLMEAIIDQFHEPEAGINIAVGPTGIQRCSDELFEGCAALSDRYNLCRHIHLLETRAQKLLAQEKYGVTAVEHLRQLGFLDHRTSLAHSIWLTDEDIDILAQTQSTVVHNPASNLRLGSGIAPVLKYLRAGVNVSFGCDGAASNDGQDLLEAIKLGTMLHNVTDPDYQHWITPQEAITMATQGGARGVNLTEHTGSLTVGKKADLVLYDLTNLSLLPRTDPLGLLVLGRPTQVVHSVWVNGQLVVADGKVLRTDTGQLQQELLSRSRDRKSPQFQMIQQVEPHYRRVMGLAGSDPTSVKG